MKFLIPIFFLLCVASGCSVDGASQSPEVFNLPVDSVELPQITTFSVNQEYEILVRYKRPTTCFLFKDFYEVTNGLTKTVSISCWKLDEQNCIIDEQLFEIPMIFKPSVAGEHVLKFWTGDTGGVPDYETFTVHVE